MGENYRQGPIQRGEEKTVELNEIERPGIVTGSKKEKGESGEKHPSKREHSSTGWGDGNGTATPWSGRVPHSTERESQKVEKRVGQGS